MNKHAVKILEFNKIKERLKNFAISEAGQEMIERLEPMVDIGLIRKHMEETSEARAVVDITSSVPLHRLKEIRKMQAKLDSYIKNSEYKNFVQDNLISKRDGRYVLPVKSEHKRSIDGNILGVSDSGSTVFVEPAEVKRLQDELSINYEAMAYYDFIFAKGKYSKSLDGRGMAQRPFPMMKNRTIEYLYTMKYKKG